LSSPRARFRPRRQVSDRKNADGSGDKSAAEPPDYLVAEFPSGVFWSRIHRREHEPLWFGGSRGEARESAEMWRFDDPGPGAAHPEAPRPDRKAGADKGHFGVCYLGTTPEASFVETFLRRSGTAGRRDVSLSELEKRKLSAIVLTRAIKLVDLRNNGLARAQLDSTVFATRDYRLPQVVARTIWRHPAGYDGVIYPTRHDPGQSAVALFDRARSAVDLQNTESLATDLQRILRWAEDYGFHLIF
jgi:hypothetical protein